MPPPDSAAVAAGLREIAAYLRLLGDNPYKPRAYETAAGAVEALGPALPVLVAAGRLAETPGIGQATAAVITEIFTTGTTRRLEQLRAELPPGLLELQNIPGLTVTRIRALHEGLGLRDLPELREAARAGRLRGLRGFGPKTEQTILDGIASYQARPARIRLIDAREAAATVAEALARSPGVLRVEIAGAVRRWKETVATVRSWSPRSGRGRSSTSSRVAGPRRGSRATRATACGPGWVTAPPSSSSPSSRRASGRRWCARPARARTWRGWRRAPRSAQ